MFRQQLADIYDSQATKFSSTRHKVWPEFAYILDDIQKHKQTHQHVRILEVGCGDGRLVRALLEHDIIDEHDSYTGVDISDGLLEIARQTDADYIQWIDDDMTNHLAGLEPNSVDIIVGVASVQHLFPASTRGQFFALAHRTLTPSGLLIMTNRARSDRSKDKYARSRIFHLRQWIQTRTQRGPGDQMIPWIDPDTHESHQRYYHFFSLAELRTSLADDRDIATLHYIDRDGSPTSSVRQARNSFVIASNKSQSEKSCKKY